MINSDQLQDLGFHFISSLPAHCSGNDLIVMRRESLIICAWNGTPFRRQGGFSGEWAVVDEEWLIKPRCGVESCGGYVPPYLIKSEEAVGISSLFIGLFL